MKSCIITLALCLVHGAHSNKDTENNAPKKLIIFTRSRSGSTFLNTLLDTHPNFFSANELFNKLAFNRVAFEKRNIVFERELGITFDYSMFDYPTVALTKLWSKRVGRNNSAFSKYHVIGVKMMHHQLNTSSVDNVIQTFHGNDLKIIYLYRSDILARYVSMTIARNTTTLLRKNTYQLYNTSSYKDEVDASLFREDVCSDLTEYATFASILQRYNQTYFSVEYDRDLNDYHRRPHVLANILSYLGLNHMQLESQLFKQATMPLETQVTNWGDLPSDITDYHYKYRNLTGFLWDLCEKQRSGLCYKDNFMMNDSNRYSDMVTRFVKLDVSRE